MPAKTFRVQGVRVSDDAENTCIFTDGKLAVYVCQTCSGTHLELNLPEADMTVALVLTAESAERLGHTLISPPAASDEEIGHLF